MRNSIQGPLLRTGNNSSFKALGETGYPVFRMAFQLREAIYRLDAGRDLARHLAIPQNDQGGDRTDWYSSFAGDVIPWSSASEQERASARQQFAEFQTSVQALSEQMLNAENSGAGGDRRVFALLLKSVVNFPDDEYLYLVNGVLVITFWGFVHPNGDQHNPMHWLQPGSVPVQESMAAGALSHSPATPAQSIETPGTFTHIRRQPGWWDWGWLLW
ncbi:SrfA family protein, partial [Pantoea agglomerans]|uniref:SrfA family protein n=1 Tax=Enterobacter agglomerans TaxID=549 RepID=UPI003C7AC8B7